MHGGEILALRGPLGAGKTVFTKALGRSLGVRDVITSPTYTIVSEYVGDLPFHHIDLYRIEGPREYDLLGLEDLFCDGGVVVIEWPERAGDSLPEEALMVEIAIVDDGAREITLPDSLLDSAQ